MTSYNMELYNIIPQRNLACYVMSRGSGTTPDSRVQAVGVDNFRFEPSNGFTIRMPGREDSTTRTDSEDFRWDPENGYMAEDEFYCGEQNLGMRNTVTLNPLHYPQSTACAYDLNELSRTGNESAHTAKDWDLKSNEFHDQIPTRVVRVVSQSGLHQTTPRSENKLRSLQRLKQLSLDDKTAKKTPLD